MYAVIETGGKQYRVEVGTELEVDLLEVEPGQEITIDRVLLVADGDESTIGRPVVEDAAVSVEVVRQARGEKVVSFKYRPKARSRAKKGHRQELTVLRVTDVRLGKKSAADEQRKADADARSERQRLEEAASKQLRVGIVQMAFAQTIHGNRDRIVSGISNAALRAVRVAVFPEGALRGQGNDKPEVVDEAVAAIRASAA